MAEQGDDWRFMGALDVIVADTTLSWNDGDAIDDCPTDEVKEITPVSGALLRQCRTPRPGHRGK